MFISSSQDQSIRLNQVCKILLWLTSNAVDSVNTNNGLSLFFGWLYSGPVIKTRQNVFIFVKATHRVLTQLLWMFPNQRWWTRFFTYISLQLPVAFNLLNSRSNYQFTVLSFLLFWILINWSIFSSNIWPPKCVWRTQAKFESYLWIYLIFLSLIIFFLHLLVSFAVVHGIEHWKYGQLVSSFKNVRYNVFFLSCWSHCLVSEFPLGLLDPV